MSFGTSGYVRRFSIWSITTSHSPPYILIETSKADWTAYLKKNLMGATDTHKALHDFMKFGKAARSRKADKSWSEFVFQAYHHHQFDAIFLAGLPDVKGSRPNAE